MGSAPSSSRGCCGLSCRHRKGKRSCCVRSFDGLTRNLVRRQTTLGARLSGLLNVPHTSLDTLRWEPNWQPCPADEFRVKVQRKMDETAETGWIIDGNCFSTIGNLLKDNATDIICKSTHSLGWLLLFIRWYFRARPAISPVFPKDMLQDLCTTYGVRRTLQPRML